MGSVGFIHSGVNGGLSFINTVGQKDELNFGLGRADQVNRAQSTRYSALRTQCPCWCIAVTRSTTGTGRNAL